MPTLTPTGIVPETLGEPIVATTAPLSAAASTTVSCSARVGIVHATSASAALSVAVGGELNQAVLFCGPPYGPSISVGLSAVLDVPAVIAPPPPDVPFVSLRGTTYIMPTPVLDMNGFPT